MKDTYRRSKEEEGPGAVRVAHGAADAQENDAADRRDDTEGELAGPHAVRRRGNGSLGVHSQGARGSWPKIQMPM